MAGYPFTSALVTGASSGIGEAIVGLLGRTGIPQVVVARRLDRLESLAAAYPNIEVLAADLTDRRGLAKVVKRVGSTADPVDLVVNNAGFGTSGPVHEADPERLGREVALNVGAVTQLSHAAITAMRPRHRGFLLNVSSVASFQPVANLGVYAATKAFVTSLTESLHEEARGSGVHVTALCPGLTRTEFIEVSSGTSMSETYPKFAWMDAEEVARIGLADVAADRAISIPGLVNKSLVAATSAMPRGLVRPLSTWVQSR